MTDETVLVVRDTCPYGDPLCPCPDGLMCHYEGPNAWPSPPKSLVGKMGVAMCAAEHNGVCVCPEADGTRCRRDIGSIPRMARAALEILRGLPNGR